MDSWTRTYLGSLFLVLTLIGVVPAQNDLVVDDTLTTDSLDLTDVIVDVEANGEAAGVVTSKSEATVMRVVRLKSDGKLEGRVSIIQATGKRLPADAEVKFARDGVLINGAKTNELGEFEVSGMEPGTYAASASIETGTADFAVSVLPYDENARPEQMILDATLTPTPDPELYVGADNTCVGCGAAVEGNFVEGVDVYCDSCMEEVIVTEEIIADPCSLGMACGSSCGFSGGGCCGGGGGRGLGWILGAGGLAAGITALALNNNNNDAPASPANP